MMKISIKILLLYLIISVFSIQAEEVSSNLDKIIPRHEITNQDCMECHGVEGFAVPIGEHGETLKQKLYVNPDDFDDSVHAQITCLECHQDIKQLPHSKEKLKTVDCITCHQNLVRKETTFQGKKIVNITVLATPNAVQAKEFTIDYTNSIHAQTQKNKPNQYNAECKDCHGTHNIFPSTQSRSLAHRLASPEVCGSCHEKALNEYTNSVHGATLKTPWKGDSAVCSDCHSAHKISKAEGLVAHRIITENCGNCHQEALNSYMNSYHGQLAWLGGEKVAKCSDCHYSHNTRKVDDPNDKVHKNHLLTTCRECHKEATASFVQFHPHGNTHDYEKYPELWWVAKIMVGMVIVVLIFFYIHSMLWFYRSWRERQQGYIHHSEHPKPTSTKHYRRFSWGWRLNHWLLVISVMTLVFTGMTAMYADSVWAGYIVQLFGSPEQSAIVHRFAAIGFIIAVVGHVIALFYKLIFNRNQKFAWFGPDSLLPRWKDASDMVAQFRWFFGKGTKPRFDRWTYWEKFDYWAVYWGALVIGLSGLILWFSEFFGQFLPGWVFNIATVAHGIEAFLAVATLFVVHFFNNHFRPGKFPLDTVMFTGSWSLEEFKEERPEEYERLVKTNTLSQYLVKPPSKMVNIISYILGFSFISFGLFLLVLVVIGFFQKGLI